MQWHDNTKELNDALLAKHYYLNTKNQGCNPWFFV